MKTRIGAAVILFLSSYLPLAVIQLVYSISDASWKAGLCTSLDGCHFPIVKNAPHAIGFLLLTLACTIIFLGVLKQIKPRYSAQVKSAKLIQSDFISYALPYIVSFMSLDMSSPQKICGFYLFMLTLFWANYKSGQLMLNPILIALDWKLYEVDLVIDGHARTGRMISKEPVRANERASYTAIDEVWIRNEHVS